MRITEEFSIFWQELRAGQKVLIAAAAAALFIAGISGWASSMSAWAETRRAERDAAHANAAAAEKLKKAAAIAAKVKQREDALAVEEERLNEKYKELSNARRVSGDAQRDYDRTRQQPRTDGPTGESVCAELAALGYSCSY